MLASLSEKCHCGRKKEGERDCERERGREAKVPSHSPPLPHSSIWPPQREDDDGGDDVKTTADKNKWGESRLIVA